MPTPLHKNAPNGFKINQMNTFLTTLLILAAIIVLLLLLALFMKKDHYVNREIIINAPRQEVYDFLKHLENQEKFNKWAKAGAERIVTHKGTDGTIGYIYAWTGDKSVGEGEKEITNLVEGERVETEIRFVKPMRIIAAIIMEIALIGDHQTKVNMINKGVLKYPLNLLIPMAEKNFAKDMDGSLVTLKGVFEG